MTYDEQQDISAIKVHVEYLRSSIGMFEAKLDKINGEVERLNRFRIAVHTVVGVVGVMSGSSFTYVLAKIVGAIE